MSSVHPSPLHGQMEYACAQSGCQVCVEHLLRQHQALIHAVLRRQCTAGASYVDLVQEGRIALWHAILHYDPHRGVAFSTYAWRAIERRIWSAVAQAQRPQGYPIQAVPTDPAAYLQANEQQVALQAALREALRHVPPRLSEVLIAAYGLDGQPVRTLAAVGRVYGVTRERARQWRNEALVLLRLPAVSAVLRCLCDQNDRQAYQRAAALNRAWLRQRRGGRL